MSYITDSEFSEMFNGKPATNKTMESRLQDEVSLNRSMMLEVMAAAFLYETGLKASEAELVQTITNEGIKFHFRKKE